MKQLCASELVLNNLVRAWLLLLRAVSLLVQKCLWAAAGKTNKTKLLQRLQITFQERAWTETIRDMRTSQLIQSVCSESSRKVRTCLTDKSRDSLHYFGCFSWQWCSANSIAFHFLFPLPTLDPGRRMVRSALPTKYEIRNKKLDCLELGERRGGMTHL